MKTLTSAAPWPEAVEGSCRGRRPPPGLSNATAAHCTMGCGVALTELDTDSRIWIVGGRRNNSRQVNNQRRCKTSA